MKNSEKAIQKKPAGKDQKKDAVAAAADASGVLKDFFIDSLKDIYWAENALLGALPKMAANAASAKLTATINEHIAVTEHQVMRLEQVFESIREKPKGKKCEAMAVLLMEGDSILEETQPGSVRDVGIIAASQKIEHYEIATYGTLVALAKVLGENEAARLLAQTLAEEKEADMLLNDVALDTNFMALQPAEQA